MPSNQGRAATAPVSDTDGADAAAMNAVYRTYFEPPYPNRATVVVKALLVLDANIEIVVHAHIGASN